MAGWKDIETSKVHRLFYPQVPVVVTVEFEGQIGGMPAIWCTPLSFDPPLIGVAVAPDHQTFKMLMGARTFGINWLDYSYAKELAQLGNTSAKGLTNKLTSAGLKTFKGKKTMQPLIEQSSANLECQLNQNYRVGTHELVVGEVLSASALSSFPSSGSDDLHAQSLPACPDRRARLHPQRGLARCAHLQAGRRRG